MARQMTNAALLREVRTLFDLGVVRDSSDRQLLERFLTAGHAEAEEAFTFLVERHGPMVLHICRHVLDDSHDAQDAFQATFLVFLRRAVNSQARFARKLALWRRHAGGATGAICRDREACSRATRGRGGGSRRYASQRIFRVPGGIARRDCPSSGSLSSADCALPLGGVIHSGGRPTARLPAGDDPLAIGSRP